MLKRNKLSWLLLASCFLSALALKAQDTGQVTFQFNPANATVKIDNQVFQANVSPTISLPAGEYPIQVWAPKRAIFRDTIIITAGETLIYAKGINTLSEAYKAYQDADHAYVYGRLRNTAVDVSIILGTIGLTWGTFYKNPVIDRSYENALWQIERYESQAASISEINEIKLEYERARSDYEDERKKYNRKIKFGLPLVGITYALGTIYFIKRIKHKKQSKGKRPVYEEANPLLGSRFRLQPDVRYVNNQFHFQLSYQF